MKKSYLIIGVIIIGLLLVVSSYTAWNVSDSDYTCAQCHEIRKSHETWKNSAHADVTCIECHGTALSNGFSSIAEKAGMVYVHFTKDKTNEDLSLSESQVLDIAERCAQCHQAEHASWRSGAHSTTYKDIFMDMEHNKMEKLYWDCFRCHGMHYDGNIHDLMSLEGDAESWHIKNKKQADRPSMTCLACHQMHNGDQEKKVPYNSLSKDSRDALMQKTARPTTALYMRAEKRHLPSDKIYRATIHHNDSLVRISDEPNTWLCMQCHAPNSRREACTEDDKTPMGIYEGMSCLDCHNPHSNELKNNYRNVHTKLSMK